MKCAFYFIIYNTICSQPLLLHAFSISHQLRSIFNFLRYASSFYSFFFTSYSLFSTSCITYTFYLIKYGLFSTTFDTYFSICNIYYFISFPPYSDFFWLSAIFVLFTVYFQPNTICTPIFLSFLSATAFFNHLKYSQPHKILFVFSHLQYLPLDQLQYLFKNLQFAPSLFPPTYTGFFEWSLMYDLFSVWFQSIIHNIHLLCNLFSVTYNIRFFSFTSYKFFSTT